MCAYSNYKSCHSASFISFYILLLLSFIQYFQQHHHITFFSSKISNGTCQWEDNTVLRFSKHGNFERMSVLASHRALESLGQKGRRNSVQEKKKQRVWQSRKQKKGWISIPEALRVFASLSLPGPTRHGLSDSVGLCASVGKVIPVQLCRQTPPVMAL